MQRFETIRSSAAVIAAGSLAAASAFAQNTAGDGGQYACMITQSRIAEPERSESGGSGYPVRTIVVEGLNFGANPVVYLGQEQRRLSTLGTGTQGAYQMVTVELPADTRVGSYLLTLQNTTGPFYKNDPRLYPIFCFATIDFSVREEIIVR